MGPGPDFPFGKFRPTPIFNFSSGKPDGIVFLPGPARRARYHAVENPASGMSSALLSFDAIVRHLSSTFGRMKFA